MDKLIWIARYAHSAAKNLSSFIEEVGEEPLGSIDRPYYSEALVNSSRLLSSQVFFEVINDNYKFAGMRHIRFPIYRHPSVELSSSNLLDDYTIINDDFFFQSGFIESFEELLHSQWVSKGEYLYLPHKSQNLLPIPKIVKWEDNNISNQYPNELIDSNAPHYKYIFAISNHPLLNIRYTGRVAQRYNTEEILYEYIDEEGCIGPTGKLYLDSLRPPHLYFPLGLPTKLHEDKCFEGIPNKANSNWFGYYTGYKTDKSYGGIYYLYERDGNYFLHEGQPAWLNKVIETLDITTLETQSSQRLVFKHIDACGTTLEIPGVHTNTLDNVWGDCGFINDETYIWGSNCEGLVIDPEDMDDNFILGNTCDTECPDIPSEVWSDHVMIDDRYLVIDINNNV